MTTLEPSDYAATLEDLKRRVCDARYTAQRRVNTELLRSTSRPVKRSSSAQKARHGEAGVVEVLKQLSALAAQSGVTGTVTPTDAPDAELAEQAEGPLPPHHQEAYDAMSRGDFDAAITEYKTAIAQDPRDYLAVAGLAQVSLLARIKLAGLKDAGAVDLRAAAAAAPSDPAAQLAVADLDKSGGHVEDAFDRLLGLFPTLDQPGKDAVRTRLLDYFEIVGADDPRVVAARRRLTALLY